MQIQLGNTGMLGEWYLINFLMWYQGPALYFVHIYTKPTCLYEPSI